MTAFLLPDGAAQSGLGHLYRCRHLADALRKHIDAVLLIDEAPASLLAALDRDGITWRRRTVADDVIKDCVVVFDGYRFGESDFSQARRRGNRVVVIDDLASQDFDCDLIVSPGPQNKVADYRASPGCRFLLGSEYALINPCFYAQSYAFRPDVRRLFVSFGGSDPRNLTLLAVEALANDELELEVVVGAGYPDFDQLRRAAPANVRLHHDLPQQQVAKVMAECDAAVAAGGTTSLELAAVGVPAILFAFAENHLRPCLAFQAQGIAAFGGLIPDQGAASFRRAVAEFRSATVQREAFHRTCRQLLRESGAARVAAEIAGLVAAGGARTCLQHSR
jgi:UDP-2,4-diacetamido-2,4,6-trideoxy-beta-L-altropyranose hydrolase